MAVSLTELLGCLDKLLEPSRYSDYCPNGLQVEGRPGVARLVSGVSACQALVEAAIDHGADALLVHHGYFWKGEDPCLRGIKQRRIARLLEHGISLLAYHLPLDQHPDLGNNARLGDLLGLRASGNLGDGGRECIGLVGDLQPTMSGLEFSERLAQVLGRRPLHIPAQRPLARLAWCTGAGQGFIECAAAHGVDGYLTGEVSEQTVHLAREYGIHFFAAGHHATERYGVQAVGDYLARTLPLEHRFIDIDNPA